MAKEKISKYEERILIVKARSNKIVKHNDLVQKSKFSLSVVEQKTIDFLVSLIKPKVDPSDIQPLEYEFDIQTYCKICGIDYENGKNYKMVRDTLKSLRDKSMILTLPTGTQTSVSWIQKFWSNKGSGKAKVRFDEDIVPYLFEICENTTRFELLNVLPMNSKYAVRMYEICRSWCGLGSHVYELEKLREMLMLEESELSRYPDFRRKVLEISEREINEYSNLLVSFEPITKGRKVVKIRIRVKEKTLDEQKHIANLANALLDA